MKKWSHSRYNHHVERGGCSRGYISTANFIIFTFIVLILMGDLTPGGLCQKYYNVPETDYYLLGREGYSIGLGNFVPDDNRTNLSYLDRNGELEYTTNLFSRKYLPEKKFFLRMSVVSLEEPGKIINMEIILDYDNDGIDDARLEFPTYTTREKFSEENFTYTSTNLTGVLEDIPGLQGDTNAGPGGSRITLRLWRSDKLDSRVIIYCGAYENWSRITIPYENADETSGNGNANEEIAPIIQILIVLLLAFAGLWFILRTSRKQNQKKR